MVRRASPMLNSVFGNHVIFRARRFCAKYVSLKRQPVHVSRPFKSNWALRQSMSSFDFSGFPSHLPTRSAGSRRGPATLDRASLLFRLLHPCGERCQTTEMIAWIEGQVRDIQETGLLISVSGIGYEVFAPRSTLDHCQKGQVVALYTRLIVREDAWLLYGFHETDLRQVFDLLISVSGIGPKLALALLSQLKLSILARAIAEADVGLLSSVSGVGKKTAERLALELQNKLPISLIADASSRGTETSPASVAIAQDAIGALVALGYRETQVRQVVAKLLSEDPNLVTDQLIRKGLGQLR